MVWVGVGYMPPLTGLGDSLAPVALRSEMCRRMAQYAAPTGLGIVAGHGAIKMAPLRGWSVRTRSENLAFGRLLMSRANSSSVRRGIFIGPNPPNAPSPVGAASCP